MAPPLEPLLLSTTSVPYLLPVFLLLFFLLAARTSPNRRGNQVGYTAADNADCSWHCSNEDTNNVDPTDVRIRGMVEQTVEAILPGSPNNGGSPDGGLDEASVERHPAYGRVYERHEPALAAALASLQRALLDGVDANTAATKLAALVRALGSDSQVTATATTTNTTTHLSSSIPLHDRTYEDILATAIVNKVIERCQQQKLLVSSPDSPTEPQKRRRRRARERSSKGSSESLSRSPSPGDRPSSRSFVSSLEVRLGASGVSGSSGSGCSGCSAVSASGELDYDESDSWSEPLALTVEETLEETTMSTVISDDSDFDENGLRRRGGSEPADKLDFFLCGINFLNRKNRVPFPEFGADIIDVDIDSEGSDIDGSLEGGSDDEKEREDEEEEDIPATVVQIAAPLGSWEDNWLFQSRRLKTSNSRGHQPVPVPMLVPNPSQDLRPLIGDIDAEETSDLSECSDDAIQDVVLAEGEGMSQWGDDDIAEACNTHLLHQAASDKDSELTVLYAAPDRRPAPAQRTITPIGDRDDDSGQASLESTGIHAEILKVSTDVTASDPTPAPATDFIPIPAPRPNPPVDNSRSKADFPSDTTEAVETPNERRDVEEDSDSDPEMSAPPRPGTIAAREHEKWQHAVPLPNNPYSPENIEKRLRQRGRPLDLPEMSNVDRLESSGPNLPAGDKENCESQRIHISVGSQPDPRRYSRDFYVNTEANGCKDSSSLERATALNGVKPRAGRARGRQEKKVTGDIRTSGDGHRGPEEVSVSLPSVKELARHFVGDDQASLADKSYPQLWCPEDSSLGRNIAERKVVIVDLDSRNHQVHSLTARSMPRAFREGLRHSSPPVTPVRVTASPKSGERPDPEGAGESDTTRR